MDVHLDVHFGGVFFAFYFALGYLNGLKTVVLGVFVGENTRF